MKQRRRHKIGLVATILFTILMTLFGILSAQSFAEVVCLTCNEMGAGTACISTINFTHFDKILDWHTGWPVDGWCCDDNNSKCLDFLVTDPDTHQGVVPNDIHFSVDITWPAGKGKPPETWADGGVWPKTYQRDPLGSSVFVAPNVIAVGYNTPWLIFSVVSLLFVGGYLIFRQRRKLPQK